MSKAVSPALCPRTCNPKHRPRSNPFIRRWVEEPLSADRGKIKVPLKPGTQTVSVHAVASERHATVLIYRLDAASSQPTTVAARKEAEATRRDVEVLHLTSRADAPHVSRERTAMAVLIQSCARGLFARVRFRDFREAPGGKRLPFRALPPTSWLNVAAARSRIAVERWKRADGLHRAMQPKQPKPPKGEKAPPKPPLLPPDRGLVMLEHGWARLGRSQSSSRRNSPSGFYAPPAAAPTGQLMCDPMDGVSRELKEFLRANYLPLMARLRAASEPAPSTGEKIFEKVGGGKAASASSSSDRWVRCEEFEAALIELGWNAEGDMSMNDQLDLLYDAIGVGTEEAGVVEDAEVAPRSGIRYNELKHHLIPRHLEVSSTCSRLISLWGAEEVSDDAPPTIAAVDDDEEDGAAGKKGGKKAPAAKAKAKAKPKALSAWDDALERSALLRILVIGEDTSIKTYDLLVRLAPASWPLIPPLPEEVQPLLNGILRYYGDVIPDPPPLPPLTPSAFIPLEDQQSRLSLKQRQAISVAAGMARAGEDAMEMSRFVAACDTLGLASPAVARLAFDQTSRGKRFALLGPHKVWEALFLAFVRSLSEAPLLPKPSHRMEYDTELVLSAARSTLLPLQYNLRTATLLGMHTSKQQRPQSRRNRRSQSKPAFSSLVVEPTGSSAAETPTSPWRPAPSLPPPVAVEEMALPSPALSEAEEEAAVVEVEAPATAPASEHRRPPPPPPPPQQHSQVAFATAHSTSTLLQNPKASGGEAQVWETLGAVRARLSTLSQSSEELQRIESWQHVQSGSKYNTADDDGDDGGGGRGGGVGGGGAQYKRSEPLHAAFSILQPKGITPLHSSPQKHGQMQRPSTASARGFSSTTTTQQQPQPLHHRSAPTLARPSTAPPAASSSSHTYEFSASVHTAPYRRKPTALFRGRYITPNAPNPALSHPAPTLSNNYTAAPAPAAATPSAPVHRPPPIAPAGREEVVAALMAAAANTDAPPRTSAAPPRGKARSSS